MRTYSFKDITCAVDAREITLGTPASEPITISFVYKDKEGVRWVIQAEGTRTKIDERLEDATS